MIRKLKIWQTQSEKPIDDIHQTVGDRTKSRVITISELTGERCWLGNNEIFVELADVLFDESIQLPSEPDMREARGEMWNIEKVIPSICKSLILHTIWDTC